MTVTRWIEKQISLRSMAEEWHVVVTMVERRLYGLEHYEKKQRHHKVDKLEILNKELGSTGFFMQVWD